jgi:hypothetical protein
MFGPSLSGPFSIRSAPVRPTGVGVRLHEPHAHPPLVLAQKHAAELGELDRRVVERSEDRLAVCDRESDQRQLGLQRDRERVGRFIEPASCRSLASSSTSSSHTAMPANRIIDAMCSAA